MWATVAVNVVSRFRIARCATEASWGCGLTWSSISSAGEWGAESAGGSEGCDE